MSGKRTFPSRTDIVLWWLVNVSSGFFLSGAHNVLFFVSDIRTPVLHFLHHASTAIFMLALHLCGLIPKHAPLPSSEFVVPVTAKFVETILSSIVHAQNRTGGLYTLRIFDFLTTLVIVFYGHRFLLSKMERPANKHMIVLGVSASLCWLEFGQMEYTWFTLFCSPLLAMSRAFSILTLWRMQQRIRAVSLERLVLHYSLMCSLVLALPALISFSTRTVEVTASWESIDFALMYMSPVFMASYTFSELWFLLIAGPRTLQVAEHAKFFGASLGQWFIQNMAHPSILALVGKILFVASAFRMVAQHFV